jgi:hypothetical protein
LLNEPDYLNQLTLSVLRRVELPGYESSLVLLMRIRMEQEYWKKRDLKWEHNDGYDFGKMSSPHRHLTNRLYFRMIAGKLACIDGKVSTETLKTIYEEEVNGYL